MKKVDLIAKLAEVTGKTKKETTETVNSLLNIIEETLVTGEEVAITGYVTFSVKNTPERVARNPKNGETVNVPAGRKVTVKAGKILKDAIKGE